MRGRGMAIVLIPNFGSELVRGLARHIAAVRIQLVDPNYELVSLSLRERQDAVFQFCYAHHEYGAMDRSLLQAWRRQPSSDFGMASGVSRARNLKSDCLPWPLPSRHRQVSPSRPEFNRRKRREQRCSCLLSVFSDGAQRAGGTAASWRLALLQCGGTSRMGAAKAHSQIDSWDDLSKLLRSAWTGSTFYSKHERAKLSVGVTRGVRKAAARVLEPVCHAIPKRVQRQCPQVSYRLYRHWNFFPSAAGSTRASGFIRLCSAVRAFLNDRRLPGRPVQQAPGDHRHQAGRDRHHVAGHAGSLAPECGSALRRGLPD